MKKCGLTEILLTICGCMLLVFLLSCGKTEKEQVRVVASIDDFKITYDDFSQQFKRIKGEGALEKAEEKTKRAVLEDMIKEQITLFEAYRLGINKDQKILAVAREKEREIAAKALRSQEVDDRVINEELLRRFYQWSDRELDLIYMKFFAGNTAQGREAAQKKADGFYQKLLSGADFKTLAAAYSEHGAAKADSGKIGRIDCFGAQEAFFEHAYPLADGGISKPFFDANSIWMVKVAKIYPVSRGSFEQAKPAILEKVQELYASKMNLQNVKFNEAIRSEFHFSLLPGNIDFFCERCKNLKILADSAGLFSPQEKSAVLCRSDVEETTIGAFLPKVIAFYWNTLDQDRVVEMLLTELNTSRLLKHKAMQMQVNETPGVKQEYQNWLVYYLKKNVIQREVIDKIDTADPILRPIYDRTSHTLVVKKQATVREIFRKTKADIDHVYLLASAGDDFAALQKKYCQNQENRNSGIVGPFPPGMNGKLGELAFSGLRIGEISSPFKYRGGYSIIQLLALVPERVKTYEEAREEIKAGYIQSRWEQKVAEWLEHAKKNYKIRTSF